MKSLLSVLFLTLSFSLFANVTLETVSVFNAPKEVHKEILDKRLPVGSILEYQEKRIWWTSAFEDSSIVRTFRYLGDEQIVIQTTRTKVSNIGERVGIVIAIGMFLILIMVFRAISSGMEMVVGGALKFLTMGTKR